MRCLMESLVICASSIFLLFLLFLQDGQMALVKNSMLEDVDAQNLEMVVFCEDVAA